MLCLFIRICTDQTAAPVITSVTVGVETSSFFHVNIQFFSKNTAFCDTLNLIRSIIVKGYFYIIALLTVKILIDRHLCLFHSTCKQDISRSIPGS